MFGYVYIDKPNIRFKDFAEYKGYYCGLCKTLGRLYGALYRFSVNYDIAFLSMLAHTWRNLDAQFELERCVAHPVGKKFAVAKEDEVQRLVVHSNVILGYYKVADDVRDGQSGRKALLAAMRPAHKRAARALPRLDGAVCRGYDALSKREKAGASADELADLFGKMMVEIVFAACGGMDETLQSFAVQLGRYVYLMDALDDMEGDAAGGRFNPYLQRVQGEGRPSEADIEACKRRATFDVEQAIQGVRAAYDKMDVRVAEGPLSNMVYLGLSARLQTVLKKGAKKDEEPV